MNFTGSNNPVLNYKEEKFIKHTLAPPSTGVTSSFFAKDYGTYHNYIVTASISGSIEYYSSYRKNVLWISDVPIGYAMRNGILIENNQTAFKLVLHENMDFIHGFPTGSLGILHQLCSECGLLAF